MSSRTTKSLNGRVTTSNVERNHAKPESIGSANEVPHENGNSIHPIVRPRIVATIKPEMVVYIDLRPMLNRCPPGSTTSDLLTRSRTSATATTARLTTSPRPASRRRTV